MIPASPGRLTWQQPGRLPTIRRLTMSTISDMAISATLNSAQVGTGPLASVAPDFLAVPVRSPLCRTH